MNSDTFSEELSYITDDKLRMLVREYIDTEVKPYFFEIAASTTGKHHPDIDLGKGGLVRHTKMCVRVCIELLELRMWSAIDSNCAVAAMIIHDTQKLGDCKTKYTAHDHPLWAANSFRWFAKRYPEYQVLKEKVEIICDSVSSHMGQWNTNNHSQIILPTPQTPQQKFVHLVDFISSRKFIGNYNYQL